MKLQLIEKIDLTEFGPIDKIKDKVKNVISSAAERGDILDNISKAFTEATTGSKYKFKAEHLKGGAGAIFYILPTNHYLFKIDLEKDAENNWKGQITDFRGQRTNITLEDEKIPDIEKIIRFPSVNFNESLNEAEGSKLRGLFSKVAQKIQQVSKNKDWKTFVENIKKNISSIIDRNKKLKIDTAYENKDNKLSLTISPIDASPYICAFKLTKNQADNTKPYLVSDYMTPVAVTSGLEENLDTFLKKLELYFDLDVIDKIDSGTIKRSGGKDIEEINDEEKAATADAKNSAFRAALLRELSPEVRKLLGEGLSEELKDISDKIPKYQAAFEEGVKSDLESARTILKLLIYDATGKNTDAYSKEVLDALYKATNSFYGKSLNLNTNKVLDFILNYIDKNGKIVYNPILYTLIEKLYDTQRNKLLKNFKNKYTFILDPRFWEISEPFKDAIETFEEVIDIDDLSSYREKFKALGFGDTISKEAILKQADGNYRKVADINTLIDADLKTKSKFMPDLSASAISVAKDLGDGKFRDLAVILDKLDIETKKKIANEFLNTLVKNKIIPIS